MKQFCLLISILLSASYYASSFLSNHFRLLRHHERNGFYKATDKHRTSFLHRVHALHEITVDAHTVFDEIVLRQLTDLIAKRSEARWKGDYESADRFRQEIDVFEKTYLPKQLRLMIADIPRSLGGGSTWSLVYDINQHEEQQFAEIPNILHLAHNALGMAASYSKRGLMFPPDKLNNFVLPAKEQLQSWLQVKERLGNLGLEKHGSMAFDKLINLVGSIECTSSDTKYWSAVECNLTGRKAADAAFWFSLAGCTDEDLFSLLIQVCVKELHRFGERSTCRAKDILRIVERLAAAGVTNQGNKDLVDVIKSSLKAKELQGDKLSIDPDKLLDLHSFHSALVIWKQSFSLRANTSGKSCAVYDTDTVSKSENNGSDNYKIPNSKVISWGSYFTDPSKPLVVDLGCGMGLSILGLASLNKSVNNVDWTKYNYIGIDLSSLTINYARGIAQRWGLEGRVVFDLDSADISLEKLRSYPGKVDRILIQFPTPYLVPRSSELNIMSNSISLDNKGNSRLPRSALEGFMATPGLLKLASDLLQDRKGELMLQSNCEDVAVWMRQVACIEAGFTYRKSDVVESAAGTPTKRTLTWVKMGGKRAIGEGWSPVPILPPRGRTETEISCIFNDTPIHRCVLQAGN